ncbi:flagellar assembly protein FliW [Calderihabitans maritimus]|uniref:Flagellar assembly factor FliW n=1 Tax=Calderihabitans maritimus TaxID=1246530 RepID=A0A1Z5HUA1_9FIRM|nr:flagellar assembly protein FliW [Calderihabitans maritimus]GAW92905.1 hypothetical protein Moth_0749 [Calderihabitans maritimus]
MKLETVRFGTLEVREEDMRFFPEGLLGFEELKEYALLPVPNNPAFHWLQAAEEPSVAFLVADPFVFVPDYEVDLPEEVVGQLEIRDPKEVCVYAIVSVREGEPLRVTANLLAPLVINTRNRQGKQVILSDSPYGIQEPLFNRTAEQRCGQAG